MAYGASIILSVFSNQLFSDVLLFSHRDAWICTMLWTGLMNYFILKASWKTKGAKDQSQVEKDKVQMTPMPVQVTV